MIALRAKAFRSLVLSWFCINVGDSILFLCIAVWVKDLTGSDSLAGIVLGLATIPALFSPLLGHLADRMSRRILLAGSSALAIPVVLLLLVVRDASMVWIAMIVVLVYSTVQFAGMSAQSGLVRDILDDDALPSANALMTTIDMTLRVLAPVGGVVLYAQFGIGAVVWITAVFFGAAMLTMLLLRFAESPPQAASERESFWREAGVGFRRTAQQPALGWMVLGVAIALAATGFYNVVAFATVETGLALPATMVAMFGAVSGATGIVGGLCSAWLIKRIGEPGTVMLGILCLSVGTLSLGASELWVVLAGQAVLGFGIPPVIVGLKTRQQRMTVVTEQGRVSAAIGLIANFPQSLMTFVGAALILQFDYRIIVLASTVIMVAGAGIVLLAGRGSAGPHRDEEPAVPSDAQIPATEQPAQPAMHARPVEENPLTGSER
ncbi:MFS transporter [Humidisolicoccus flavus]|uniref:MFS transporter n=1 Tax=Humidisolicoccus flavus TaxID=3111414 RepID=UPI0032519861